MENSPSSPPCNHTQFNEENNSVPLCLCAAVCVDGWELWVHFQSCLGSREPPTQRLKYQTDCVKTGFKCSQSFNLQYVFLKDIRDAV